MFCVCAQLQRLVLYRTSFFIFLMRSPQPAIDSNQRPYWYILRVCTATTFSVILYFLHEITTTCYRFEPKTLLNFRHERYISYWERTCATTTAWGGVKWWLYFTIWSYYSNPRSLMTNSTIWSSPYNLIVTLDARWRLQQYDTHLLAIFL